MVVAGPCSRGDETPCRTPHDSMNRPTRSPKGPKAPLDRAPSRSTPAPLKGLFTSFACTQTIDRIVKEDGEPEFDATGRGDPP